MRYVLLAVVVVSLCYSMEISGIRELYSNVKERVEGVGEYSDIYLTEMEINSAGTSYPALGSYGRSFDFYWDMHQESYPVNRLLLITVSSTYAAVEEYEEFLFNSSGELVFYYRSGGYDMNQERFYYDGPYLQRYILDEESTDSPDEEARVAAERIRLTADKLFQCFYLVH